MSESKTRPTVVSLPPDLEKRLRECCLGTRPHLTTVKFARTLAHEVNDLRDALRLAHHSMEIAANALTWSKPQGGECCNGTISDEQAGVYREEADEALDSAIVNARKFLQP